MRWRTPARRSKTSRAAAAKKNAHKDHGDAAESVLIPFRPFVDARIAAHADAASGEVLFVRETTTLNDDDDDDDFGDRACTRLATGATTASKSLRARAADSHLPGAEAAGKVLAATLTELDRLHVNASCRVRQRAPAVAAARSTDPTPPRVQGRVRGARPGGVTGARRGVEGGATGAAGGEGRRVLRVRTVLDRIDRRVEGPLPALRADA